MCFKNWIALFFVFSSLGCFGQTVSNQDSIQKEFSRLNTIPEFAYKGQTIGQFISENIRYPEAAKAANIEYKFQLEFTVDTSGSISKISNKDSFPTSVQILFDEAVRVLQLSSGKWIPGTQNGKPIRFKMRLPVKFELM